jgi:N-acetylmuramoyl-L-alanine amidase
VSRAVLLLLALATCRSSSPAPGTASAAGTAIASAADAAAAAVDGGVDAPLAAIKDWPIKWPPERDKAMLAYRRTHSDADAKDTVIAPRMIVLHYTAGGSAKGTHDYFDNLHMEEARAELRKGGDVNVSAHFLVDRDGTIFRLVPETTMARHAIGVNHIAIGVENVGDEDKFPLTDAQVEADAALVRDLVARYPSIELLVGHHEVRSLEGTSWFVERDPKYRNRKPDPGPRFMAAVRAKVADLKLKGPDDVIRSRPASP